MRNAYIALVFYLLIKLLRSEIILKLSIYLIDYYYAFNVWDKYVALDIVENKNFDLFIHDDIIKLLYILFDLTI